LDNKICFPANRQIEILELEDLEKEYSLARIRLTLARHDPSVIAIAGRNLTANRPDQ
jgi:hypothetical protein